MTYTRIDELFGAPLNTVPLPQVPFKYKDWHYVTGITVILLAAYGAYRIYENVFGKRDKISDQR